MTLDLISQNSRKLQKKFSKIKSVDIFAPIFAIILSVPIINFLLEGIEYSLSGNFSLGIDGGDEVLGTFKLIILTSLISGSLGIINSWLLSKYKFNKIFKFIQLIPLAIPTYLITAILQDLGSYLGYQVTGLPWGVLIIAIATYPIVFTSISKIFQNAMSLRLTLPALFIGLSLASIEVINTLGTPALLNIPNISTGIVNNWIIEGNSTSAIGLSLCALAITAVLLSLEKILTKKYEHLDEGESILIPKRLKNFKLFLAILSLSLPAIFYLGVPIFWVLLNVDQIQKHFNIDLLNLTFRTFALGGITAIVVTIFSVIISLNKKCNNNLLAKVTSFVSGIGYVVPGTVLAIALLSISSSKFIAIMLLIWGYTIRFLAIPRKYVDSALDIYQKPNWKNIVMGGFLVFVATIKELPLTFILRPFDYDTLSVRIYQYAGDERLVEAIIPSVIISILGLFSVRVVYSLTES